jgi:hypothetical protein
MKKDTKVISSKSHDGLIDIIINKLYQIDKTATKNPVVVGKAKELKGKNKTETIKNCFEYVYKTVTYCDDPRGTEHITSPWLLISGQKTCEDCESMVLLLSSLLRINGIKTRYKVISWKSKVDKRFSHIVLEAEDSNKWIILDPTMKSAGYGHTVTPNRTKTYSSPMPELDLVTLSDNPTALKKCRCRGRCNSCNRNSTPPINNIINIGNHSNSSNKQSLSQILGIAQNDPLAELNNDNNGNELTELEKANAQKTRGHKQLYSTITSSDGKVYKYPELY